MQQLCALWTIIWSCARSYHKKVYVYYPQSEYIRKC